MAFYLKNNPECSCPSCHDVGLSNPGELPNGLEVEICMYLQIIELSTVIDSLHLLSSKCCRVDWSHQWSLCALHSTCVWAARCLKIEQGPNYCSKHRCGKLGLRPTKSQTPSPGHSMLCVPVWKSNVHGCTWCMRARVRVWVTERKKWKFVFVREWVQTTPFEASAAVRWGLGTDTRSLCWLAGNSISHIRAATHALFIPQSPSPRALILRFLSCFPLYLGLVAFFLRAQILIL